MLLRPKLHRFASNRPERALLISYFDPRGISTVPEILAAIQSYSIFSVTSLNLFEHRYDSNYLKLNPHVDLSGFDIIIVHNSVAYNPANVSSLDELLETRFADFDGVKILFKQDENFKFRDTAQVIAKHQFDIVLTCLPEHEIEKIYPRSIVGSNVLFEQMLTGYITPPLRTLRPQNFAGQDRPIDIGYRGSFQPLEFGRLCYEKRQIGNEVKKRLNGKPYRLDISSRWEDRYGGNAWFDFLSRCRCTLGVESGASIFDLDCNLSERIATVISKLGPEREDEEYAEKFLNLLHDLEHNVAYNQISPRHFEAAACGTLQIMYPGSYSSIFQGGQHFLSLERNYSNFDEVIDQAMSAAVRRRIVECAYEEIVLNPRYWIESFVARLDELILDRLSRKGQKRLPQNELKSAGAKHQILLLSPHRSHLDPRLRWIVEGAPNELSISLLGLQLGGVDEVSPLIDMPGFIGDVPLRPASPLWITLMASMVSVAPCGNAVLRELFELERLERLSDIALCERYGASVSSPRLADFRWYVRYMLDICHSLVMAALALRGVQVVVAADLPTLPAALILKAIFGTKVVYDAHEYWAENDARAEPFEIGFWQAMEQRLVPHTDHRQVVSPGLAELMSKESGCGYFVVPNCTPKRENHECEAVKINCAPDKAESTNVRFLFQGLLVPGRGLEELVQTWKLVSKNAQLVLRGPEDEFKKELVKLAKEIGLDDSRIIFLPAVKEDELITAAMEFDVGVIPYPPSNTNNINCCPNKMSQYMAAGLPLLANSTNFVRQIVQDAACGIVVDFSRPEALVEAVNQLALNHSVRHTMAAKAFSYFRDHFHWAQVSQEMYAKIGAMVKELPETSLVVWPSMSGHALYRQTESASALSVILDFKLKTLIRKQHPRSVLHLARKTWLSLPRSMQVRLRTLLSQVRNRLRQRY